MRIPKIGEKVNIKSDSLIYKIFDVSQDLLVVKVVEYRKKKSEIKTILAQDLIYIDPEQLSGKEKNQLVDKFVKPDFLPDFATRYKELSVLNRLLKLYPNLDFWRNFNPNFQVKSLLWWMGGGKKDLILAYNSFTLNLTTTQKPVSLQAEKIGEDVKVQKKISTFSDLFS